MAISPIDLQTLYMQMDKVGKSQLAQQAALEQAKNASEADAKKAAEAKAKSVNKTETGQSAVGKIADENASSSSGGATAEKEEGEGKKSEKANTTASAEENTVSAPTPLKEGLGANIDISI